MLESTILENKANKADFLEKSTLNRKIYTLNIENWEQMHKSFTLPPINGLFWDTLVKKAFLSVCCETKQSGELVK